MNKIEIKQFDISEINEITLLSIEEAGKVPVSILACGEWWWLRSPGYYQYDATYVYIGGGVYELGDYVYSDNIAVRPAFRINNLESEIGGKIMVGKTWCTVVDEGLALADCIIGGSHRFDKESNNWETSELKAFIESDEFKAMI